MNFFSGTFMILTTYLFTAYVLFHYLCDWSVYLLTCLHFIPLIDCRIRGGIQGIHIIHNKSGRSTGQAFIELEHEEDVGKALDQHKQYLGQRYVEGKGNLE